jgi:hypothetical protein
MSEKTPRKAQLYLHCWIAEPEVYGRNVIHVELEAADAYCAWRSAGGSGFIRWREGDSSEELRQRLYRKLGELCRPRQVWTDNSVSAESRRREVSDAGR